MRKRALAVFKSDHHQMATYSILMCRFHGNFYAVQVFTVNNITSTKYTLSIATAQYVNLLNRYCVHKMGCDVMCVCTSGAHSISTWNTEIVLWTHVQDINQCFNMYRLL